MKHSHSCHTADELEIGEVILIAQAGVWIYLESVVVPGQQQKKNLSPCNSGTQSSNCLIFISHFG